MADRELQHGRVSATGWVSGRDSAVERSGRDDHPRADVKVVNVVH